MFIRTLETRYLASVVHSTGSDSVNGAAESIVADLDALITRSR